MKDTSEDGVDDAELVTRAQSGDAAAMNQLLARHFDYVYALCRRMLRDPIDADDARQDALIKITRNIATFHGRAAFRTWVHAITRNVCLNTIRAAHRRAIPVDEPPEPVPGSYHPGDHDGPATRLDIESALDALPAVYHDVVVLRYVCDLDYAQIAATLDIPLNTVRSKLRRGRAELVRLLGEPEPPAPVSNPHMATPAAADTTRPNPNEGEVKR